MIESKKTDNFEIIKLNNPPVNAICKELLDELDKKLNEIEQGRPRALILTGEGKAFVGGADISEMKDMDPEEAFEFSRKGQGIFKNLSNLPMPVIAAVNGYALGGGLELALSCDFIISSKQAQYGQPEVGLGVIPGFGGTQRLSRKIGVSKAKELIFTGKRISAEEAFEIGLVDKLVQSENLMESARGLAKDIASNAPLAIEFAKESIERGIKVNLQDGFEIESEQFRECFKTEDQDEGMKAFLDKREPEFKGK